MRGAEAITRLALGQPVARVSLELGYSSASVFIAMFRQVTGDSPQRYLASK
jgi:AraC-like DNA-binding protein